MNVLHVYRTYFPDPPGGLQEAIQQIALGAQPYGVTARVFALSPNSTPRRVRVNGIEVFRERSWIAPASCDLGGVKALTLFRELAEWADVVHFHFPWPFADLLNLCVSTKAVRVMTYHSDIVRQRFLGSLYWPLMVKTLSSMDAVVATSPNYAATSPALTKYVHPDRLKVIPLGIADRANSIGISESGGALLERLGVSTGRFVLALGVLRYYKGLHYLINAATKINAPVVIAGSGPEEPNLRKLVSDLRLKNIIFAGQVSNEEKNTLLQACALFAFPSHLRSEAFGMVLVEAAMYSKPLVTCEIGSGMSYVNSDGVTGFVVLPESPDALAEPINRLLNAPELAKKMGEAARLRYEKLFAGELLGEMYSNLYRDVLAARSL